MTAPTRSDVSAELRAAADGVEQRIAARIVRHAMIVAPVVVLVAGLVRGTAGAWSAGYALAIVAVNFFASAAMLSWAARFGPGALAGAALGGYALRLALVAAAVLLVRNLAWVDLPTLGLTIVVTHLGLLAWEARTISLSLAAPGARLGAERAAITSTKEQRA